jgi:hypothetical protein
MIMLVRTLRTATRAGAGVGAARAKEAARESPATAGATAVSAASFSGEFELLFGMNQSAPGAQRRRPRLVHPHPRREHSGLEEVV